MNKYHLLYWIFRWMTKNHPDVLKDMLAEMDPVKWGYTATYTIRQSLQEAYDKYKLVDGSDR